MKVSYRKGIEKKEYTHSMYGKRMNRGKKNGMNERETAKRRNP